LSKYKQVEQVKQSDLGEYEENVREKQRDTNIQGKLQDPPQTKL
jgi:hypothetical protein